MSAQFPRIKRFQREFDARDAVKRHQTNRDPAMINAEDFQNREDEGVLYVERAGELLYRPEDEPSWGRVG